MTDEKRRCSTCDLYSRNWYGKLGRGFIADAYTALCCADTVMDLPDSWDNSRVMLPHQGKNCPIWREIEVPHD